MAVNREKALTAAAKFASKGQHDRAAKEYISIIEADPSDVRSWLLLAEALVNAGDKTGALERYLHVGKHYAETADPQKAIAVYRKVLGIDPNRLDIQTAIASLYKDLGRNADAVAAYEFVAQAYFQAGQIAEGLEGFRMVAELEPAAVGKRLRLAELYSREGMVAQAVEHFRLAAERLFADRRTDDYIRVAERLIYHKEDDLPVLRSLAQIYLKQGENRRALVKLNALLRAAPADAEGLELLGETFVAIGKTDKAISVVMELAREQRKGGRKAKETAARVLRKALGWNPENAEDIKKTAGEIETEIAALPPEPKEAQSRDEDISLDVDVVEDEVGAEGPDLDLDVDVDEEEERKVEEVPSRPFAPVDANVASSVVEAGEDSVGDVEKVLLEARVYVRYKMFEHALGHLDTVFVREADHIAALELQAQILTELVRNAEAADTHVRLAQLASGRDPKLAREHLGRAQALVPDHNRAEMVLAALDSGEAGVAEAAPLLRGLQANLNGDPETEARTFDPGQSSSRNALVDPDAVAVAEQSLRTEASANDAGKPEPTQTAEAAPESVVVASEPESPQAAEAAESVVVASEPEAAAPVGTDVKDAAREVSGASKPTETSGARPLRPLARESSGARRQSGEATTEGSGARRLPTEVITEGSGARRLPTEVITEGSGARRLPTETTPAPISSLMGRFGEKTPHPSRLGDKTPLPSFKPPPPADATTRPASVAESGEQKPLPSFKGPPSRSTTSPTSPEPDAEGPRPTKPTRKPPGTSFKPPPKATPTRPSAEVEEVEAEVEELDVDEVVEPAPLPKKGPPVRPKPQPPGRRPPPSKPAPSKPSTSESADALPATEPAVETSPANETSPDRPTAEASSTASDAKPDVAAEAKPEVAAQPEVVTELETKPEVAAEAESKPEVAAEPESKPEVAAEPESKPEVAAEPEVATEPESKPEVATEPESKPEVTSEPETKPEVATEPESKPEPASDAEPEAAPAVAADEYTSTDWPDITDEVEELRFFISGRFDDDAQFAYLELQRRFPGHPVLTEFAERFTSGPRLESAAAPVTLEDATPAATPAIGDAPATVFPLEDEDEDSFLSSIFDEPVAPVGSKAAPRRAVATLDDGADAQTFFDLGTAYREMGLLDDALSQFDLAARDNRWTSRARVMMASLRVQRGENDLALADLQTAIDSATDQDEQSEARYELGVLYQALGDNERAIAILQAVAPGYRDRDERLTMLGV